ncbi:serine/threonine-protein kinase [Actinoallomurus liliacearum]|uniref:serine/threonine-protein kinase n=1 Tax=Actinoallomurus liliacearum TaxID=1080073 RepID=UPI0031F0903F
MLARRAHYAPSVLSVAAAGYRLPTWDVTAAFVTACGGDVDEWRERWTSLHTLLQTAHPDMITDAGPPAADTAGPEVSHDEAQGPRTTQDETGDPRTPEDELPASVLPLARSDPAKVGPFRLLGRLGGGAMGQVYLGESKSGRPVAVKVVRPHLAEDPHFRRRFVAEIAAVRRVDSPYTPAVIDAAPEADPPWMATAYIPGPSLGEVVGFEGPLPPATVLRLAAGIAEALEQIHAAGILHRDLKPANVLLEPTGPKVIDFGVAQAADGTRMTQTGAQVGTIPFMAPEQADGRPYTAASDVFSLGSVLAYAATGVLPFGDGTTGEVLYRIIHTEPDPAALDCHDDRLRALITRCLDKEPGRRPTPEQIIDACSGQRLRMDWLPASVDAWAKRSIDDIAALLGKAAGRRAASVRLRLGAALLVVVAATAAVTATFTGGSGSGHRAGGGHRSTPVASPRAWTAASGPSCSTGDAVAMDTSGSWTPLAGTGTGGCGNALIHRTTDSSDGANWVFHPGVGKTCVFRVDIPNSSVVDASIVTYQAWDTIPGKHTDGHRIGGNVRANQSANRGKALTVTFGPTKNGVIDLQIYDDYPEHRTEVAGTVTATCR